MAEYYTLQVAGLTRKLKRCRISDKLEIAAFILFSDVELTVACAKELAEKCADCNYDYIMTAESKGIPDRLENRMSLPENPSRVI